MGNEKILKKLEYEINFMTTSQSTMRNEGAELSDYSAGYLRGLEIARDMIIKHTIGENQ